MATVSANERIRLLPSISGYFHNSIFNTVSQIISSFSPFFNLFFQKSVSASTHLHLPKAFIGLVFLPCPYRAKQLLNFTADHRIISPTLTVYLLFLIPFLFRFFDKDILSGFVSHYRTILGPLAHSAQFAVMQNRTVYSQLPYINS